MDLGRNKITDVSPLNSLVSLKELQLYNNQIKSLDSLTDLKNLQVLGVANNDLDKFPDQFKNLSSFSYKGNKRIEDIN